MDSETKDCGVCFEQKDLVNLQCCRGPICQDCLNEIVNERDYKNCPFCQQDINKNDMILSGIIPDDRIQPSEELISDESEFKKKEINAWLERQAQATPGLSKQVALTLRRFIAGMRPHREVPNFDYTFIGYYYSISDLWSHTDRVLEFNRLREFTRGLNNYVQPYDVDILSKKVSSNRLIPHREVRDEDYIPADQLRKIQQYDRISSSSSSARPKILPPPIPGVNKTRLSSIVTTHWNQFER